MKPAAARSLGLTPGEITLIITDLQGSTELWEWNPQVMDVANALHAQLARRLLKKYCGYEVATADAHFAYIHLTFNPAAPDNLLVMRSACQRPRSIQMCVQHCKQLLSVVSSHLEH